MPVYQYRCAECRHLEEALQKMSDPPLTECPKCAGKMHKIIAPVGIIFKGSGWHVNDYRPASEPASPAGDADKPKEDKTDPAGSPARPDQDSKGDDKSGGSTEPTSAPAPPPATESGPSSSSQKQVA